MPSEINRFSGHYPIREFARITGVNPVTLRAWERRYGIVQPQRTDKGHRFYSEADIQRVNNILYWLEQGYPVRQVKLLLQNDQPQALQHDDDDWQQRRQRQITAISEGQLQQLDRLIVDGLANYPMSVFYQRCLQPVMAFLQAQPLHYQLYCQQLKRSLICLVQRQQKHNQDAPLLLLSNHESQELFLYAMAYALGAAAFRVEVVCQPLQPADLAALSQLLGSDQLWADIEPTNAGQQQQWAEALAQLASEQTVFSRLAAQGSHQLPDTFAEQLSFFIQHQTFHKETSL